MMNEDDLGDFIVVRVSNEYDGNDHDSAGEAVFIVHIQALLSLPTPCCCSDRSVIFVSVCVVLALTVCFCVVCYLLSQLTNTKQDLTATSNEQLPV